MASLSYNQQKYGYKLGTASMFTGDQQLAIQNKALIAAQEAAEADKNRGGFFGGLGYFFEKIGLGFLQGIEGIWDYAAGGLADLFGADEWAEQQFANDWVNYNDADEWYNPSDGWKVAGDVASGIGTSLPALIAAAGTAIAIYYSGGTASGGAAVFWESYGPAVAASIVGGLGAAGQTTKEAYQETGELGWKEYGYGALSGITEAGLEFASAGIGAGTGRLVKNMGKGTAKAVGKEVTEELAESVAKSALKDTAKGITAKAITTGLLKDFASEAFEEGVQEILSPYYKRWTGVDPDAENATAQQVGYAALVGGLSGVLMGGAGNVISSASNNILYISKGNKLSQNPTAMNSIIDYARKAAAYETEHNTGEGIYQQAKKLIEQYDALSLKKTTETTSTPDSTQTTAESGQAAAVNQKLTLAEKKLIGQLSDVSVGLVFSEPVKRSRNKILANPEAFIKIINDRNIIDGTTGKPFHFNSVEELLQNQNLLLQFSVGDALGEIMLRKDSAYDYIMSKKNTGLTQEEFRLFQKEASAAHKQGVNEVYGVDVDSITYEDFIEKMKTTGRQTIESKQTAMRLRNQSKKAIAKAINEKQDVADIKTYDRKSNIENGTTVYKVTDKDYVAIIKDSDGFYVYAGGNISVKLNRKQLNSFVVQLKKAAKGVTEQTSQAAAQTTSAATQTAAETVNVEETNTVANGVPAAGVVNTQTGEVVQATTQPVAEEVAATVVEQEQAVTATDNTEPVATDAKSKAKKTQELIDAEDNVPANVLGYLLKNKTVDFNKIFNEAYNAETQTGVEHFAASESDYVRQGKFSAKALAQAISENAEEINAAYKNNRLPTELKVKVWDRAFEIDSKELPAWYKEQYHAKETTSETATAAEPAETTAKKLTDKGYDVVTVDSKGVKVLHKAKTETAAQTTEKTAKKKTTKKKTEDFGEKIGGARKDEWTKRGLSASDIAEMNQREIERHVKKENVWKRPNFVDAVANGGNRGLLYAQNEIFKSLNTRPYLRYTRNATVEQITDNAKRYADEVKAIQNIAESIKTKDDIVSIGFRWGIEQGYIKVEQNAAGYTYTEKYYDSPALYGSDFLGTLLKLRRKFDSLETIAMREGFGVAPENKLPKGYEIHEKTDWQGRGQGSFYIVKGRYIVLDGFTSYEQALATGKERFGTAATSKTEKNGKKRFIPPQLKDVHREGLDYRNGKNVTGDDFLKDFQIKGGEFGNWLTEADRTESLNYAYDAFCDLADALNIELSDIALQKTLSIGFGSRGQGLSGAVAHYEPDRKVINLTKMNGAGSLGHEWWHAFEDYITGSTSQSEMSSDFSNLPEKTRAAAKELVAKMNYKDGKISADEQNANNAKHLDRYNRILESQLKQHFTLFAADMDESTRASTAERYRYKRTPTQEDIAKLEALKKKAFEGDAQILAKFQTGAPNIIDEISELRKEVTGRGISKEDRSGLVSLVDRIAYYKTVVTEEKTVRVKTDYYNNAVLISQQYSKDGGYWDSNAEMLARAFASYITDKTNRSNDYLSGHSENPMPIVNKDGSLGVAYAMPVGEERIVINEAFDKLFAAAKEDGLISNAKRKKPTTTSRYAVSEVTDLNNQPNGSKSQKIAPLQMKRAESIARQNIKGYENLTEAEKLEVEWTLASSWSCGVDNAEAIRLAQISAELGTGIGFANISQPSKNGKTYFIDGVCYTRGEHSTIYLDPKNANNVETIVLEELTHAFEKTEGYSTLREMADKYYAEHTDEKEAIEKTYREFYAKENVRFAEEILPSELTAHYVREVLGKRSMIAELTKESPKTTKGILGWLKAIKNRIKKADTSATAVSDVELLENRFKSVYNQYRNRTSSVTAADSSRMSIADVNGKPTVIVDTDQHIFEGVDKSKMGAVVQKYMQARYRGKTINETVFTRRSELEYTYSRDTQRLYNENSSAYEAKMRASTELDNLIITGELIATETPKHVKPINEGGIKRYKVEFVVGDGVFNGELLIAVDKKGVNSFYDIVKIKESNKSNISPNAEVRTNALSDSIIRHSLQNVNTSGEISTDSQGNSLTAEQQSFFKDSKVVDKDGKLLVVYHGSPNLFTEFSHRFMNTNGNAHGRGFYFTEDMKYAEGFKKDGGQLLKGYLDIKKPASETELTMKKSELVKLIKATCEAQAQEFINEESYDNIEDALLDTWVSNYVNTYDSYSMDSVYKQVAESVFNSCDNDVDVLAELTNGGAGTERVLSLARKVIGYDGIIFDNGDGTHQFVAFESNQFKNDTNTKPTTSTDIRYALRSEDVSGSDRVMSSLPNDRVSVRDVITKKKTRAQLAEQVKGDTRQYAEGFQIAMTNAQAGLERVMRQAGIEDATALTNYVRAAKYAGNNALEVDGGQYNLTGETRLGDSWGKIWQPIYKLDAKDGNAYVNFQTYLLHWHNIDRMAVGKPVFGENVTAADSQAAIAKLEEAYPTFRKTAEKVWKFLDNNLQLSVDSGMYSQEYVDSLREMYPHYVPTYREEHSNSVAAIVGKNNVRVSINKMKASGSDLRILPIDDVVASQTIQKYSSARINDLLIKILDGKKHDEFSVMSSEDANIDIDTETLVTTYEDKAKNKHQITFYKGGKRITAEVSQNLYRGVEAFMPSGDQSFNNILLNGFAKVNSLFKKLVTSWNPFFSYFRNPIRDIQDAGLYTRYPIKTFAKNYGRARTEIQNNGKYWQEAKAAGISAASVYDYEKGLNYKKDKNIVKRIGAKLEAGSNTIEMTPRLAEYISARETGLSVQEALLQAQDVTTNFGRGGVFAKKLNATIMPFLNPAIQGFSKMTRAYMGKDAARSWINLIVRSVLLGIGMTALNDLLNDDDEDYENLSDYVKENNYVIGIGNGNFIKIPKGRVVSVFGGAFLRSKWYMEGDEKAFEGYLSNIASQVTPVDNFSRTIFSPITDLATNTTWYGGTIEGQKWDDTQPKDRYDETTSSIAIWLGQVFNYSPTKIDYLLEQYGGIVTDVVLPATTLQAEKGIVTQNLLVNSTTNSRWSTEFYEQKEDYTYKKTAGDNAAKGVVKYLNGVNSTISDMSKQKREIHADKRLSNDEKLKQANVIQAAINALEKDSLTNAKYLYEELKKYGEYGDLSDEDYFDRAYLDAISVVIGEEYALKSYNKKVYEKAQSLNTLGISYGFYYDYYFAVKDIESEYNADGSTVAGSKKANIISYTMNQNLPLAQKLILIMSAGYKITDGDITGVSRKTAIKTVGQYISKLPVALNQKIALAELCGLTVKNGKIIYD